MVFESDNSLGGANANPNEFLIDIADLEVTRKKKQVLTGLSLSVGREAVAVLGPNGVGKTTLLEVLVGLRPQTNGQVTFHTRSSGPAGPVQHTARTIVGFVPQNDEPISGLTVSESITYAGWLKGLSGEELRAAVSTTVKLSRCSDFAAQKASKLSGGQFRRMLIAQAIVHNPDVLVLDEPTAALDPQEQINLQRLLIDLKHTCAVIFTTHNLRDLPGLADRVVVMNEGRALIFDSLREFCGLSSPSDDFSEATLQQAYERALAQC